MPINNDILGIYKQVYVLTGGTAISYIVETANRNISIDASPKILIAGSPKTRIMDIGGITETISISAPILIGGGAAYDGRALVGNKITEILNPASATLPILKSASYSISEGGGSLSVTLESDGYSGSGNSGFYIVNSTTPHPSLNPVGTGGSGTTAFGPTRVARFYDFRAKIGGRQYFIQEASVDVNVETQKTYFINPYDFTNPANGYGTPSVTGGGGGGTALLSQLSGNGISWVYGSQFPHIGVNGITISGKGKGAVVVGSNYASETTAGITTQAAGVTVLASSEDVTFALEIAGTAGNNPNGTLAWQNLIAGIGLSKSIINATSFSVSTGILTVEFDFMCYVV
jgi:hypothetical protein